MSQDATTITSPSAHQSWWSVLGWAAYLACSWTWCIGMFLPVLLVRDYGIWGFVVFAVPNVVGAGAMGWVLRKGASEWLVARHRAACVLFSVVTAAFQAFFLGWAPVRLLDRLETTGHDEGGYSVLIAFGAAAVLALIGLGMGRGSVVSRVVAGVILVVSMVAGILLLRGAAGAAWSSAEGSGLAHVANRDILWLAPVCVFGFALCPYLDLTFHRARQALDERGARGAFSVGFGVLFASMILITLAYAPLVLGLLGIIPGAAMRWLPVLPLLVHLLVQLTYTILVHTDEVAARSRRLWVLLGMAALCAGTAAIPNSLDASFHGMLVGEIVYRCFMSFFGLVFPAYVWLCMIPTADGHSGIEGARGRWKLGVCAAACLLAAPCYWMGFIERVEWWLAPGLAVVLVSRFFVRKKALGTRQ